MAEARSIKRTFFINTVIASSLGVLLLSSVWIFGIYAHFKTNVDRFKTTFVNARQQELDTATSQATEYINYKLALTRERLIRMIEERVHEAHAIATAIYTANKDTLPLHKFKRSSRKPSGQSGSLATGITTSSTI